MIIVATVTPDQPFPTVSCMLQEKLGAKKAASYDDECRMCRVYVRHDYS